MPEQVKISKKNICIVTMVNTKEEEEEEGEKMLDYFL